MSHGATSHLQDLQRVVTLSLKSCLPLDNAKERVANLMDRIYGSRVVEVKKKRAPSSQVGRKRKTVFLDGMGAGGREMAKALVWRPMEIPDGADMLPKTREGAVVWLRNSLNTGGFGTVLLWSNSRTVVRRCVQCVPTVKDAMERSCGCAFRMDKADGWVPKERMGDAVWDGRHLAVWAAECESSAPAASGHRRSNSPFPIDFEKELRKQLKLGTKPKRLYASIMDERAKTMSRKERRRTVGKEAWEALLGYGLQKIQDFAKRERKASANGYNVESLVHLKVCKIANC
jgi:hypothetical protein